MNPELIRNLKFDLGFCEICSWLFDLLWQFHRRKRCHCSKGSKRENMFLTNLFSVFPTVWNKIRPNFLKITANSAKIIFKFGHNSATFLANFDPIFSFYCIFMWQFFQIIKIWTKIFKSFLKKIFAFSRFWSVIENSRNLGKNSTFKTKFS